MTSSPPGPYAWGYTRATMAATQGLTPAKGSHTPKTGLSPDCSLQLDSLRLESLVIADHNAAVNTCPGLVHTAPHTTQAGCTRSSWANPEGRQVPKVWLVIGVKS